MKTKLSKIAKDLEQTVINENEARILLLDLLGVGNNMSDQIFKQSSKIDEHEFNLKQHWKDKDDKIGFDSKPIGGFKDW